MSEREGGGAIVCEWSQVLGARVLQMPMMMLFNR
jgi:hypothetical protein